MRCSYCNKNEATKSYESIKNGEKKREYYCHTCYERMFLFVDAADGEETPTACPYCGTTVREFQKSKIVGCPYCYQTLSKKIVPVIVKMQGDASGHRGKMRPLSIEGEARFDEARCGSLAEQAECRETIAQEERFIRQKREMEILIAFWKDNEERQAGYKNKLERMEETGVVEEEIVW